METTTRNGLRNSKLLKKVGAIIIIVALVLCCFGGLRQVSSGHKGVKVAFGNINLEDEVPAGLTFRWPWLGLYESNMRIQEYTMSATASEGEVEGNDSIDVLTSDNMKVVLDLTVRYFVKPGMAGEIYDTYGNAEAYKATVIRPDSRSAILSIASGYSWDELSTTRRAEFVTELTGTIGTAFDKAGFTLDAVLLRNVLPPTAVVTAINLKIEAQTGIETKRYEKEIAAEEAQRVVIQAQGIADAQRVIDETLTPEYLEYERIQMQRALASSPNTTFIFIPSSGLSLNPDLDDFKSE